MGVKAGVPFSLERAVCLSSHNLRSRRYLVTADDFGKVKLFNYPVIVKNQVREKTISQVTARIIWDCATHRAASPKRLLTPPAPRSFLLCGAFPVCLRRSPK